MNCHVSAVFLHDNGLLLSVADEVMSLEQLIEWFWRLEATCSPPSLHEGRVLALMRNCPTC
ncbi:hypothetical protein A1348_27135 [Pseudomonas protegens]|nr:hypothetical protein A1348_27135 [Pseudomonas protegens]